MSRRESDSDDGAVPGFRRIAALTIARALGALALGAALLGPSALRPFAWIPAVLLVALVAWRPTEHYGHLAVDGALLAGALATATVAQLPG